MSFVFSRFFASFPLFLYFAGGSVLPPAGPSRFSCPVGKHAALPYDKSPHFRQTIVGYHISRLLSSEKCGDRESETRTPQRRGLFAQLIDSSTPRLFDCINQADFVRIQGQEGAVEANLHSCVSLVDEQGFGSRGQNFDIGR